MAGKRKKAEAHHGGAWKVAYADFVTAMMALFMVLWISAQDKEILIATSKYFQSPFKSPMDRSAGVLENSQASVTKTIVDSDKTSLSDLALLNKLAKEVYRQLNIEEDPEHAPLDIQITNDGLRVVIFDRHDRPLFEPGKAEFTEWGGFVMENLAWLIDRRDFKVRIDGHTASGFVPTQNN
jgi:chemotaxis protein MotB